MRKCERKLKNQSLKQNQQIDIVPMCVCVCVCAPERFRKNNNFNII